MLSSPHASSRDPQRAWARGCGDGAAAGVVSITVIGSCASSNGSLKVRADAAVPEVVLPLSVEALCNVTSSAAVTAGAAVDPTVVITTAVDLALTTIKNWNVTVVFTPG